MGNCYSGLLLPGIGSTVDLGTCVPFASPIPGFSCPIQKAQVNDEITPIAEYMAGEMNANAHGTDAKRMAELNRFDSNKCIADYTHLPWWQQLLGAGTSPGECVNMKLTTKMAAMLIWTGKVRQDGEWDHKLKISHRFHPRDPQAQQYHHYNGWVYYYDVWSNLHYGYVGTAAGISESALLDGAGGEQVASDLLRGKAPTNTSGVKGLRAWDDMYDRAAITAGIKLYRAKPNQMFAHDLIHLVVHSPIVDKRPLSNK
jgi:hypothetical protein